MQKEKYFGKMHIIRDGLISLCTFSMAVFVPLAILYITSIYFADLSKPELCLSIALISYVTLNVLFFLSSAKHSMQVIVRASFLGCVFFCGVCAIIFGTHDWNIFGWYICVLSTFHYSEYFCISITNPKTLSIDAFMLNHSVAYGIAAAASWIEFLVEHYYFSDFKARFFFVSVFGLALCIIGETVRKLAMLTASTNFNHVVQTVKEGDHKLVTHGIYSLCRHPSYVGWFYWSIGTQCILVNPLCVVVYALASFFFFKTRLVVEEEALINFFGDDYVRYKKRVRSGLPFNDGLKLET